MVQSRYFFVFVFVFFVLYGDMKDPFFNQNDPKKTPMVRGGAYQYPAQFNSPPEGRQHNSTSCIAVFFALALGMFAFLVMSFAVMWFFASSRHSYVTFESTVANHGAETFTMNPEVDVVKEFPAAGVFVLIMDQYGSHPSVRDAFGEIQSAELLVSGPLINGAGEVVLWLEGTGVQGNLTVCVIDNLPTLIKTKVNGVSRVIDSSPPATFQNQFSIAIQDKKRR